jgi:hypothetical protein
MRSRRPTATMTMEDRPSDSDLASEVVRPIGDGPGLSTASVVPDPSLDPFSDFPDDDRTVVLVHLPDWIQELDPVSATDGMGDVDLARST